jgi:hypothetical protein
MAILEEHRFFCPLKGCDHHKATILDTLRSTNEKVDFEKFGLPYKDALKHQRECPWRKVFCPKRCGTQLLRKNIEEHLKTCPNVWTQCPDCEMVIYTNRPGGNSFMNENGKHDCFAALLAATKS